MKNEKQTCMNCKCFNPSQVSPTSGECRRYPPKVFVKLGEIPTEPKPQPLSWRNFWAKSMWSEVSSDDWCGEWQAPRRA